MIGQTGPAWRAVARPAGGGGDSERMYIQFSIFIWEPRPEMPTDTPLPAHWFQILLALADRDLHGLEITKEVFARTEGAMHLWPGKLLRRDEENDEGEPGGGRPAAPRLSGRRRPSALLPHHRRRPPGRRRRSRAPRGLRRSGSIQATAQTPARVMTLRGCYRAILRLCPSEIRDEYGAAMEAGFLHSLAVERARRGAAAESWPACTEWPTRSSSPSRRDSSRRISR